MNVVCILRQWFFVRCALAGSVLKSSSYKNIRNTLSQRDEPLTLLKFERSKISKDDGRYTTPGMNSG